MKESYLTRHGKRIGVARLAGRAVLPVLLALGGAGLARAGEGEWTVLLEPMQADAFGHDQHVLTIHEIDLDSAPTTDSRTPVTLDTESAVGYRVELQYTRPHWRWGLDVFWFNTSQGRPSRTAAGPTGGTLDAAVFEVADRSFTADEPGEVLFFSVLEDTDLSAWAVDLYGMKTLIDAPEGALRMQFGLRNADFDNDYHHVVGLQNVAGSFLDASSNYARLIGPLVGFAATLDIGRSSISGYLGQSVVFGTAELLTSTTRDFVGAVSGSPTIVAQRSFGKEEDVAIPITELRIGWLYPINRHIALGVSANTSLWWDVPVPPGVVPIPDGDEVFHENTLVFFGLAVAVKLTR